MAEASEGDVSYIHPKHNLPLIISIRNFTIGHKHFVAVQVVSEFPRLPPSNQ